MVQGAEFNLFRQFSLYRVNRPGFLLLFPVVTCYQSIFYTIPDAFLLLNMLLNETPNDLFKMTSRKNWEQDGGIQGIIPDFGQSYDLFWVSFFSFINCFSVTSEMKSSKVLKKRSHNKLQCYQFHKKNRPECHPFKSSFRELKQTLATIFRLAMTNRSPALIFRVLLTIHDIAPLNHTKSEHTEDRGLLLVHNYAAK